MFSNTSGFEMIIYELTRECDRLCNHWGGLESLQVVKRVAALAVLDVLALPLALVVLAVLGELEESGNLADDLGVTDLEIKSKSH